MLTKQPSPTKYCTPYTTDQEMRRPLEKADMSCCLAKKREQPRRSPHSREFHQTDLHLNASFNFVTHGWLNCLDRHYTPPDLLLYGWQLEDGVLVPLWFEGDALPEHLTTEENQTSRAIHKSIEHDVNSNSSDDNDEDEDSSYELSEESSDEDDGY